MTLGYEAVGFHVLWKKTFTVPADVPWLGVSMLNYILYCKYPLGLDSEKEMKIPEGIPDENRERIKRPLQGWNAKG